MEMERRAATTGEATLERAAVRAARRRANMVVSYSSAELRCESSTSKAREREERRAARDWLSSPQIWRNGTSLLQQPAELSN